MTPFRYGVVRTGQFLGLRFTGHHAGQAAKEARLLREAEEILGRLCWQDVEDVEELGTEYWMLRKLSKESEEMDDRINRAEAALRTSQSQRSVLLEKVTEDTQDLVAERERILVQIARLADQRSDILREARSVKRRHDGIKAKLEVLMTQGGRHTPEFTRSRELLHELKRRFHKMRSRRDEIAAQVESNERRVGKIEIEIDARRQGLREEEVDSYQDLGQANRDVTNGRAKLRTIESQMADLFSEIGRFLSTSPHLPECRGAVRPRRGFVGQVRALRASIGLNNRLAGQHGTSTEE
jgi:chromosome segregation ATPase